VVFLQTVKVGYYRGGTMKVVDIPQHLVTHAVHKHGAKILMQILHSGRYGYHHFGFFECNKSPISPFKPRQMSKKYFGYD
jgi:2,4-dienoyl-CoA reductase (NADPH2)